MAAVIIGLVLIQHGKGADVGAAFGSGSAGSVFGSAGSANFMSRLTAVMALVFFLSSMGLTWLSTKSGANKGVMASPAATPSVPDKIPGAFDAPSVPVVKADKGEKSAPLAPTDAGSKAGEVPK